MPVLPEPSDTVLHKPGVGGSNPPAAIEFSIDHEPAAAHHGRPQVSCSQLKALRESPLGFYYRHEVKTAPPQTSEALSYGSLLHTWAELGDAEFWPRVVTPPDTFVTAAGALSAKGKEWAAGLEPDKIPISPADEAKLRPQTRNLLANPEVRQIIADTIDREFNIVWKWNGHGCRARIDGATPQFFYDWKTTSDKDPSRQWWNSVLKFGYHLQSAMYQNAGVVAGWPNAPMRFIVTSTVWPYENCVCWLPPAIIERGRRECLRLLDELQMRRDFDMWTRIGSHTACELYFPAYALKGE